MTIHCCYTMLFRKPIANSPRSPRCGAILGVPTTHLPMQGSANALVKTSAGSRAGHVLYSVVETGGRKAVFGRGSVLERQVHVALDNSYAGALTFGGLTTFPSARCESNDKSDVRGLPMPVAAYVASLRLTEFHRRGWESRCSTWTSLHDLTQALAENSMQGRSGPSELFPGSKENLAMRPG